MNQVNIINVGEYMGHDMSLDVSDGGEAFLAVDERTVVRTRHEALQTLNITHSQSFTSFSIIFSMMV